MFVFNSHAVAAFPPLEHFRSPARPVMAFRFLDASSLTFTNTGSKRYVSCAHRVHIPLNPPHGIVPCQPYDIEPRFSVNQTRPTIR